MNERATPVVRDRYITIVGSVGFAAALAAASQVAVPVPGTSVPMTLQPLAVVLAGLWLGPVGGAASMVLYLAAGAAGLPVFAPVGPAGVLRLLGPTGGYLLAYPVGAFIAGALTTRRSGVLRRIAAAALGIAAIHVGGVTQLAVLTGSLSHAVVLGTLPFLGMDLAKALIAGVLSPGWNDHAHL